MPKTKYRGLRLQDRVAIITGGAYGIGRSLRFPVGSPSLLECLHKGDWGCRHSHG